MSKTLKLHVADGVSEANVGGNLYAADADGTIAVDAQDAALLLSVPGFTAEDYTPPPSGFVRMKAPVGASTCSVGGTTFEVAPDGIVVVPALNELASHGFIALENTTGEPAAPYAPEPFVMDPEATFVPEPSEAVVADLFVLATPAESAEPAAVAEPVVAEPVVAEVATPETVAEPVVADAVKE